MSGFLWFILLVVIVSGFVDAVVAVVFTAHSDKEWHMAPDGTWKKRRKGDK